MSDNTCQDVLIFNHTTESTCEMPSGFELYATMGILVLILLLLLVLEIRAQIWKKKEKMKED